MIERGESLSRDHFCSIARIELANNFPMAIATIATYPTDVANEISVSADWLV
jgi:hypothetical protein